MSVQEVICTQCGSNELKVVSSTVFECESCGTILKEEPQKEVSPPPSINKPKEKPFRSKRIQHGLKDQFDNGADFSQDYNEAGNQFIKMIFWIGILGGVIALVGWLLA